jgi:hypothetical protein
MKIVEMFIELPAGVASNQPPQGSHLLWLLNKSFPLNSELQAAESLSIIRLPPKMMHK